MKPIWWEKTVEYKFVLDYSLEMGDFFVTPLDGNLEAAGDTIFAAENKWILIEFKRNHDSLKSEESKFTDYQKAYEALFIDDAHHFLIYGKLELDKTLTLECTNYFRQINAIQLNELFKDAAETKEFFDYIDKLNKYKKQTHKSTNNSSASNSYTNVIGINKEGKLIATGTIQDIHLKYEQRNEKVEINTQDLGQKPSKTKDNDIGFGF